MRCLVTVAVLLGAGPLPAAFSADHLDAPNVAGDGQADINDLYAFQSPANPDNTVLIMTVNPAVGVFSPATFGADVTYAFQVDNNGDAVADLSYEATFAPAVNGTQQFSIAGPAGTVAGATGVAATGPGVVAVQAGLFEDPFFFDLVGFNNGFAFTGDDFFAGLDVSAIVLEVPSADLGATNVGVWATTSRGGVQVDRMGRPAITTALIPADSDKTAFNLADPAGDLSAFQSIINASIAGLSDQANADALTSILLPDVLTIDTSDPSGFLNGRGLADDVIDAELTLLTGSPTPVSDGVDGNDVPFLAVFPYLAPANIPEPAAGVLVLSAIALGGVRSRRPAARSGAKVAGLSGPNQQRPANPS